MKIRQGHVSNSSSSSFLLIVTKELHEELKKGLHPYIIAAVESRMEEIMGGKNILFNLWSGSESDGSDKVNYPRLKAVASN